MSRPVVLVIDDEPAIRLALRFLLRVNGYTVVEADDGASGLAAFARHAPDAVLLDVFLPDMTGIEVLERLDATRCPVIMLSAVRTDMQRAAERGAAAFLLKPFANQMVLDTLAGQIRHPLPRE